MKVLGLTLCILACAFAAKDREPGSGPEYYWRDFEGHLPIDAMSAAPNTYMGQVLHDGHLLPAQVTDSKSIKRIYAEFAHNNNVYTMTGGFKIFCTIDPNQFQWIKTDSEEIKFLMVQTHFIVGGSDGERPYLVGRSIETGNVGKIVTSHFNPGLQFVMNDNARTEQQFEAIAYK